MPVKLFASRDSEGRPWPPDQSHEVRACLDVVKRLWMSFQQQDRVYSIAANLHLPSADLVIVTELGIGIIEFKHNSGRITRVGDTWYANGVRIKAGSTDAATGRPKYANPHRQVQDYASDIREKLIHPKQRPEWLPGFNKDWNQARFQTAVCFTHPLVILDDIRQELPKIKAMESATWEEFDVLTIPDIPAWAAALRMGMLQDKQHGFRPYRISPQQNARIMEHLLRATEWTEVAGLMPTGQPYAYLALIEGGVHSQIFALDREDITLGRDADSCSLPIPRLYSSVGRKHARITRTLDGIFVEDLNSKNGTFVDDTRSTSRVLLRAGNHLTLGGPPGAVKACHLEFSRLPFSSLTSGLTSAT